MRSTTILAMVLALVLPGAGNCAEPSQRGPQVGDAYEIVLSKDSSQQSTNGSSGSSQDRDALVERVVGVRPDGLELEYDLPKAATADERAITWQFPARVFRPQGGPLQLLNRPELEARADAWLKGAKLTRAACGHWYFTWNVFRIECDPQSVIGMIAAFDLRPADLREGAPYRDPDARAAAPLAMKAGDRAGATFEVKLEVDPDATHRHRAEGDVVLGELMQKPVTLDAALQARMKESVSGTISLTWDVHAAGDVWRRTKVTELKTKGPDGEVETDVAKEIVERRALSKGATLR